MNIKPTRKLFVIIQPLQYLQAVELFEENEERVLVALFANGESQLHSLVNEDDWDKIVWVEYSGTALDLIKHRKKIKNIFLDLGGFNEIILSAYYNEFMNMVANEFHSSKKILLEDGMANILINSTKHYKSLKFLAKYLVCKIIGFDIKPVKNVTLFTLFSQESNIIPSIAKGVIVNDFKKLRRELNNYSKDDSVCFISSAFISVGIMRKEDYVDYIIRLAKEYSEGEFNVILHRFDNPSYFETLKKLPHVRVIKSTGPVELYFKTHKSLPRKIITAGSGATETLNIIYGIDIEVVFPNLTKINEKYREQTRMLFEHFEKSFPSRFI